VEIRRVVTGLVDGGDATVEDIPVPVDQGTRLIELWRVVGPRRVPDMGFAPARSQGIVQEAGGLAWRIFVLAPGERPLHRTPTLDLLEVLNGSIVVTLDVGEETLHAGDCLVLRGDVHGWRNEAATPAILVAAMFGTDGGARERSTPSRRVDAKGPRRIVTGVDEHGRSIVSAHGVAPNTWGDAGHVLLVDLWQTMAPLAHCAQGADAVKGEFQWQPAGAGIAWRHASIAPGAEVSLRGSRLDLVFVRSGEVSADLANRDPVTARAHTAIVRRGAAVDLRNHGRHPVDLSVLSVCHGTAADHDQAIDVRSRNDLDA
jgi:quercetin dioxygenase-like cupin family protein